MPELEFSNYVDFPQVKRVGSFDELVTTPLANGINALCWARELEGDFEEIVRAVGAEEAIVSLDEASLRTLRLSEAGERAREVLIADLKRLDGQGLAPNLDCIPAYPRDDSAGPFPTDVYSFHVDSAPVIADTYLCSYTEAASEGVRNEEARRWADVPAVREQLLAEYGGADDAGFTAFLTENYYDLHYRPDDEARPFGFGLGNLWRIANACPGSPVLPCIHRAPTTRLGASARLLLIS